jgi:midasin
LKILEKEKERIEGKLGFKYIEGNLIKAMKRGDWLLLDEVNLASSEVL